VTRIADRLTDFARRRHETSRTRVLVVDDDASVRDVVARMLTLLGHDVSAVADPAAAIRRVHEGDRFDLAVLDVVMPIMYGDELARQLRRRDPDLKVLYLTGYSDQLFMERSTLWANEAYVDKPVTIEGLHQAVSLLLVGRIAPVSTAQTTAEPE